MPVLGQAADAYFQTESTLTNAEIEIATNVIDSRCVSEQLASVYKWLTPTLFQFCCSRSLQKRSDLR